MPKPLTLLLEAWTAGEIYYSWDDMPCASEPSVSFYGYEFRRLANVSVQMTVTPVAGYVDSWWAVLLRR